MSFFSQIMIYLFFCMQPSEDNVDTPKHSNRKSVLGLNVHGHPVRPDAAPPMDNLQLQRVISIEEDHLPQPPANQWRAEEEAEPTDLEISNIYAVTLGSTIQAVAPANDRAPSSSKQNPPPSPREQPVGRETDTRVRPAQPRGLCAGFRSGGVISARLRSSRVHWGCGGGVLRLLTSLWHSVSFQTFCCWPISIFRRELGCLALSLSASPAHWWEEGFRFSFRFPS